MNDQMWTRGVGVNAQTRMILFDGENANEPSRYVTDAIRPKKQNFMTFAYAESFGCRKLRLQTALS